VLHDLLQGVWLVDGVIVFMLIEVAVLLAYRRRTGRGVDAAVLLPNVAAGLCLLLALSAALHAAGGGWIALALTGAGVAHVLDLRTRWRHRAPVR
jgi:hypothetical protein